MNVHDPAPVPEETGESNPIVRALLGELAGALSRLAADGEETIVALDALTLAEADLAALEAALGRGEVSCELDVAGRSEVVETGFSGVWWIRHYAADDRVVTRELAVTRVPDILASHPDDVAAASIRLHGLAAAPFPLVPVEEPSRG